MSSHAVVAGVRRRLGGDVKVGHAGTLDPFATGLLIVLVGRATRAQRFLMALPKTYEAIARLGARSDTGDPEGEIVHTGRVPARDAPLPVGEISQAPPAYSAVKVSGERAYRRARRGEAVRPAARTVTVHRFQRRWQHGRRAAFRIECSSGTYVRVLISDLGDAYCEQLRRTAIGPFAVSDADPRRLIALDQALGFLPEVRLAGEDARRAGHGTAVALPSARGRAAHDGPVRLTDGQGLIAVGEPRGALVKPVVGFRG